MDTGSSNNVFGILKTPLQKSLIRGEAARAQDALASLGQSLPCTVVTVVSPWIVTINFEVQTGQPWTLPQMTVPVLAPPYVAYPIQPGDAGVALAASARLGGLSGLGTGAPSLQDAPGNLSCLGFVWLGKVDQTTIDPDAVVTMNNLVVSADQLAFFGGAKIAQQTVAGPLSEVADPAALAVLTSLIAALAAYALIVNATT